MIGKIERVPLWGAWKHEALDFTQRLPNNLDVNSRVTDLSLVSAEREQAAGKFSADLAAEDAGGSRIGSKRTRCFVNSSFLALTMLRNGLYTETLK